MSLLFLIDRTGGWRGGEWMGGGGLRRGGGGGNYCIVGELRKGIQMCVHMCV